MKITMYELLGLVKDGKAPKIIKYKGTLYEYDSGNKFYFNDGWSLYREFPENGNCLNDEVEILEEEKKIPEKIEILSASDILDILGIKQTKYQQKAMQNLIIYLQKQSKKINEIIDYLKSKGE